MQKIAILSDTHNVMRQEILDAIKGCDAILHAGDICDESIMDQLRALAPVYAVRGNNDFGWSSSLSRVLHFQIGQLRFVMAHEERHIPYPLTDVDIVIYGHTHRYTEDWENGIYWLNPGSAGWARYNNELSYAIMTIEGRKFTVEKYVLVPEKRKRFFG